MRRTLVLNVVGLTPALLAHAPNLRRLAQRGGLRPLATILPAVTCSVQATLLTGRRPDGHGIVGNGWYDRSLAEVMFWKQSNALVEGPKLWDEARRRDPGFTVAQLFWWYNMYAAVDWAVTPRPIYCADGRKLPDVHTHPGDLRDDLTATLGPFPLFKFWGPATDLSSSRWIADCAGHTLRTRKPTLTLVYLPHLDYALQKLGPTDPAIAPEVAAIDAVAGALIEEAEREGLRIVALSEYGITRVTGAVAINRALRRAGWLRWREELGQEKLDPGASDAFAVVDHQIAHIHVRRPELVLVVKAMLEGLDGVEAVLDTEGKRAAGLDHPRAGDLVAISRADRWFSYYWWLDDAKAPDYARTVDIHRKPGYDPVELFLDPALRAPKLAIAWRLLKKAAGFRTLMDVIPLDASLVRGSHGRPTDHPDDGPLFITSDPDLLAPDVPPDGAVAATQVKDLLLAHVFGRPPA